MRVILILFAAAPLIGAAVMFGLAVRVRRAEPELRRTGERTVGTVVDNRTVKLDAGGVAYRPVVEYATTRQRAVRAAGDLQSPRAFVPGTRMVVVYDPRRPREILVGPSPTMRYRVAGWLFLGFGIVMTIVAYEVLAVLS